MEQIKWLKGTCIKPGVNLLVSNQNIEASRNAYKTLLPELASQQITILPMRHGNTPSPEQLAYVAGHKQFQAPSCLLGCNKPHNFVSVTADKKVNFCSYAEGRVPLSSLDFKGLQDALAKVVFKSCE